MGSTRDPSILLTFEEVADEELSAGGGIGFVLSGGLVLDDGTMLVAFDVDACREPLSEELSTWAVDLIEACKRSYTEITPSGTGLRIWLRVRRLPAGCPILKVMADPPPGVDKRPEIQVFGLGPAGYVTTTFDQLPGTSDEILEVPDLQWLLDWFDVKEDRWAEDKDNGLTPLPVGEGDPPSFKQIMQRVQKAPHGRELLAGDYEALGYPSASEAAWALLKHVLRAAANHGQRAVSFLLSHTVWGQGMVDSREPGKYTRRRWWEAELRRLVAKSPTEVKLRAPGEVFRALEEVMAAQDKPNKVLKVLPAHEWVETKPLSLSWLFLNLLPASGVVELFGPTNQGKSAVALSLCVHAGLGRDWLGFRNKRRGWWLYLVAEGAHGMANRMRATAHSLGVELSELQGYVYEGTIALMDEKHAQVLYDTVEQLSYRHGGPPAVIVLDTLAANFGAGNENATEDASLVAARLQRVVQGGRGLMVYVHHMGHDERKKRSRGSSALIGAVDATIMVRSPEKGLVRVTPLKARDWTAVDGKTRALKVVALGVDDDGDPVTSVWLDADTDVESAFGDPILDYLAVHPQATLQELATALGVKSKGSLHKRVKKLRDTGELSGDGSPEEPWLVSLLGGNEEDLTA